MSPAVIHVVAFFGFTLAQKTTLNRIKLSTEITLYDTLFDYTARAMCPKCALSTGGNS